MSNYSSNNFTLSSTEYVTITNTKSIMSADTESLSLMTTSSNDNNNSNSSFVLDECMSDLLDTSNSLSEIIISEEKKDLPEQTLKTVTEGIFTIHEKKRSKYFEVRVDHENNTIYCGCKIKRIKENVTKAYCRNVATNRLTKKPIILMSRDLCEMIRDIPPRDYKSRNEMFYHCLGQIPLSCGVENNSFCMTNEDFKKLLTRALETIRIRKVQKNRIYLAKIQKDLLTNDKGKMLNQLKKVIKKSEIKNMTIITCIKTTRENMLKNRKLLLCELNEISKISQENNSQIIREISLAHPKKITSSLEIATSTDIKLVEKEIKRLEEEKLRTEKQTRALEKQIEHEQFIKEFINSPNKLKLLLSKYTKSSPILINQNYDSDSFPNTLCYIISNVTFIINTKKNTVSRNVLNRKGNAMIVKKYNLMSTKIMAISYNEEHDVLTYGGCVYSETPETKKYMTYDEDIGKGNALQRLIKMPVIINNFSKTDINCVNKLVKKIVLPNNKFERLECERKMRLVFDKILLQYLYNKDYACYNNNSNTGKNIGKLEKISKSIPSLRKVLCPQNKQKKNLNDEKQARKYLTERAKLVNNAITKVTNNNRGSQNIVTKSFPPSNLNIFSIEVPSTVYFDINEGKKETLDQLC